MEGCDSPVIPGKDNGCGSPQHQQWTVLSSAHLPDTAGSMEQPAAESCGPLDSLRVPFPERVPESSSVAGPGAEPASKEVSCGQCAASFAGLQSYMEHRCTSARPPPPLRGESGSESSEDGDEESDVENLAGEIVYQPDGSAYIEQGNTKALAVVYGPHEVSRGSGEGWRFCGGAGTGFPASAGWSGACCPGCAP